MEERLKNIPSGEVFFLGNLIGFEEPIENTFERQDKPDTQYHSSVEDAYNRQYRIFPTAPFELNTTNIPTKEGKNWKAIIWQTFAALCILCIIFETIKRVFYYIVLGKFSPIN